MKIIGAVLIGLACLSATARAAAPAYGELRDDVFAGVIKEMKGAKAIKAGYIPADDPNAGKPSRAVEWVYIPEGEFKLGTPDFSDAKPIPGRIYTIKNFEMSKTLVTVEQYAECVVKGGCAKPDSDDNYCNWGKAGRELHPVNCVSWVDASDFAKFKNARLPSEAEWEYAATSGGKNQKYPWGNEDATCERAVMYGKDAKSGKEGFGCGNDSTMPVCSKPAGNTIQGLCDAVGNVWQWVQDKYQSSYADAPTDGRASVVAGSTSQVLRGGSFINQAGAALRTDYRNHSYPTLRLSRFGFRLARSASESNWPASNRDDCREDCYED